MDYSKKDFLTENRPKWCAGCGCFAVLTCLAGAMAKLGVAPENNVIVSGIGCSSRLPYFSKCFGFHTIHGRAPAVATGVKLANPALTVWLITGDGDGLSIGANHLLHLIRRNVNVNVVLFNNQIYGLTKGQTSPTSPAGSKTKSSPYGSIEQPLNPVSFAIANGIGFAGRVFDNDIRLLEQMLVESAQHNGTSIVEVLLNCVTFTNGAFAHLSDKISRPEKTVTLKEDAPVLFGREEQYGVTADSFKLQVCDRESHKGDVLIHQPGRLDSTMHYALANMQAPDMPVALGIIRRCKGISYEEEYQRQSQKLRESKGAFDLGSALRGDNYWKTV